MAHLEHPHQAAQGSLDAGLLNRRGEGDKSSQQGSPLSPAAPRTVGTLRRSEGEGPVAVATTLAREIGPSLVTKRPAA